MTSPSGRHLGYHYSLFKPDGIQQFKDKIDFSERMLKLRNSMTSIALLNKFSVLRWITSIFILLSK